jgi:hypothetical protein
MGLRKEAKMKEKIQKFWEEHKEALLVGGVLSVLTAVAVAVATKEHNVADGRRIVGVNQWDHPTGKKCITVYTRSGRTETWFKKAPEVES